MKLLKYLTIAFVLAGVFSLRADACTSMIVSGKASATGRPLLWKHRDTGTEHNFVQQVEPSDGFRYVGLFDGGDSLLTQAWMGMNERGFAIMNTASYNLAPDTAKYKDMEGVVMALALKKCQTLADFATLLDTLPKPMGVQANFGVIDAEGNGAYFETNDVSYTMFSLADAPEGYLIRTNHSLTGNSRDGYGYVRYHNALDILSDEVTTKCFSPQSFTEKASRSFWHSLIKKDFGNGDYQWVVDQDFIPRRLSSASIVIEGVAPGEDPTLSIMWTAIGYPPCSYVVPVMMDNVPEELLPTAPGWRSPLCNKVLERKRFAFPLSVGNGSHYIDMDYVRSISPEMKAQSEENYEKGYEMRDALKQKLKKQTKKKLKR